MRVCIAPYYHGPDRSDGGIRRVIEALIEHLPSLGWDVTDNPDNADVIHCHGATLIERPGVPLIVSSHGMMWEDYFAHYADEINRRCIDAMVRAQAVTAPSQWVANAISRGMLVSPEVVYHGVDADVWQSTEKALDYVLWNKARTDPVSDPNDMQQVAELLPDVRFLSTYGQQTQNVLPIGVGTYEQMRPIIQRAAVYLATTRETFGIGTLEALAAGVPIAGWDYGGQAEIVIDGQTGYLAPFGDLAALADAIRRCVAERDRLSRNCVEDARARWGWQDRVAQYARLYARTVEAWREQRPKVSVVVTCYNLERYLGEALTSVAEQTMSDWECVIVDDCSTDDTAKLARLWTEDQKTPKYDGSSFTAKADPRFRYVKTPRNLGLSGARNYGWQHAKGRYVLFLDADDMLERNAFDLLANALDRDSSIHIAYGSLDTMSHDGSRRQRNPWPAGEFSWHAQVAHLNQLHGASLMRREVLERSGGYRVRDWRAEDASFWARVTSFGFRAAKVTEDAIQVYRMHEDQKSRSETGDGDWTAWLPWRIAGDAHSGMKAVKEHIQPNARIVPFGAQGAPPPPMRAWPVRHFQHPLVSVIIPVGPGHADMLVDALDSVQAQTFVEWEAIVVWDAAQALHPSYYLAGHPWARLVVPDGTESKGAGAARNIGLAHARAPFVVFLDADDVLHPRFLEETLRAYDGSYVYTDWATLHNAARIDGEVVTHTVEEYDQRKMLQGLRHAITALVPTEALRDVGGFDEQLPCFEDWDLYCKLAVRGYCGKRLAQPLLIYRYQHGQRTRTALKPRTEGQTTPAYTELGEQVAGAVRDRYAAYLSGEEKIMGCGSCGGGESAAAALNDMVSFMTNGAAPDAVMIPEGTTVRMEFIGDQWGAMTFYGKGTGYTYLAGRDPGSRYHDVHIPDVEHFVNIGLFRVVAAEVMAAVVAAEPDSFAPAFHEPVERPRPKGRRVKE